MRIEFYKALWGMEGTVEEQLAKIAQAGYDGYEAPIPGRAPSDSNGLGYVAMLFVSEIEELERGLERAAAAGAELVNVHSGRDWWDHDQGSRFFEKALEVQSAVDIPVCHETHRGRLLFSPAATSLYLSRFPELKLTADFSHWTCVCESLLEDQQASLQAAIEATWHLHARVGHEEGPQVPDPRAEQWTRYLSVFEGWWDRVVASCRERKLEVLRVDPEFGPPHYMQTDPGSGRPVVDLWEVCWFVADRLRRRWQA